MVFSRPFGQTRILYFIGIGGIGMSAIARVISSMGYTVLGSDLKESEITHELSNLGISISIGHHASHITREEHIDVVVTSSAISPGNAEILAAHERNIPIITRGELLAEIMRLKEGIAIAGTHGKTTTTSMVTAIFQAAGLSPTAVIGGKWVGIQSNAQLGKSQIMICESDESDGSFLHLTPVLAIVTNIDLDHMDFYKNEENLLSHFVQFINNIPFYGKVFLCFDSPRLAKLHTQIKKPYASYGLLPAKTTSPRDDEGEKKREDLDITGEILEVGVHASKFNVRAYGENIGQFTLNMPGKHNVLNSLSAIGVALEAGIAVSDIQMALKEFQGVERRLSVVGMYHGLRVMDDYGHHPTEVRVTLQTLKQTSEHLIVAFQPHRYSRTLAHYLEFAHELLLADKVYLLPVYAAGEEPIEHVSSQLIFEAMRKEDPHKPVINLTSLDDLIETVKREEREAKGTFLTIGAGNVYQAAKRITQN